MILLKAFLGLGAICIICCFTIDMAGSGDPTVAISLEYAKLNPLAILFIWSSLALSVVASLLYIVVTLASKRASCRSAQRASCSSRSLVTLRRLTALRCFSQFRRLSLLQLLV